MEPLQKQILTLSQKVDAIYQVIESLDRKLSQGLSDCFLEQKQSEGNHIENYEVKNYKFRSRNSLNADLEHKDVLIDGIYQDMNPQSKDKQITPEIQIQRLTAQLTAAYNRIAALEEQLLRSRIN